MKPHTFNSWLSAFLLAQTTLGSSFDDYFANPGVNYRPKFRYWLPDASADPAAVRRDIHAMADAGAGGFEFLPYYQFGPGGWQSSNWSEYGYGSAAFRPVFRAAMEAAEERGLLMDFAVAANQGQGVPAEPETLGLAVHLTYSNITLAPGEAFNGTLPLSRQPSDPSLEYFMHPLEEFGSQELVAVLAVETLSSEEGQGGYPNTKLGQVIDLTSSVGGTSRHLSWAAPVTTSSSSWRVMAFYQRYTNQRSINAGTAPSTYLQNGSWIVDHFSAAGAKIMTEFFDDHVVPDPEDRELLAKVGKYAWEDSMEMNSAIWWTPGFADKFLNSHGYDIWGCLPLLLTRDNAWARQTVPYGESFEAANGTLGSKCIDDYRLVLQQGYTEYVQTQVGWVKERGLEYSNQPAYNLPLSTVDSVLLVDAPEGESYGFKDKLNSYKYFSGPAHMSNNPIISSECGGLSALSYTQTLSDLKLSVDRGLAGGVSMNVFHGFPYSGPFQDTTWPGVTIFGFRVTEMWGPRLPLWKHMPRLINYVARSQLVLQTGAPRVDIAFYAYGVPFRQDQEYAGGEELSSLGYTYEYVGPASLVTEEAVVQDGLLAPGGPAYKALVFSNETKITPAAAAKLGEFARAGLPIFFIGDENLTVVGANVSEADAALREVLTAGLPNVVKLSSADELVAALESKKLAPRARLDSVRGWYSFWRSAEDGEIAWLYRDGLEANTSERADVVFSGVGGLIPYTMDAWTGTFSPVLQYTEEGKDIVIPVALRANESTIFTFRKNIDGLTSPPATVVASLNGSVSGFATRVREDGTIGIVAQLGNGTASVVLANGSAVQLAASSITEPTPLETWSIHVEDWHRGDDTANFSAAITILEYTDKPLLPWNELGPTAQANVSGIGHYSTNFTAPSPPAGRMLGARLHLGQQPDSTSVSVNSVVLPPVPGVGGSVDITGLVSWPGGNSSAASNELRIEVATNLFNRVRAETETIKSMGVGPETALYAARPAEEHGLRGPVWIEWVEMIDL